MANDKEEQNPLQPTEDQEITRKTDIALLSQKDFVGYQRTARIDNLPEIEGAADFGNAFIGKRAQLNLNIEGQSGSSVQVTLKDKIVVGRALSKPGETLDLDLTPYNAAQLGGARRHVMITKEGNMLKVVDLGSTNGTYLNGVQRHPNQPRVLRTGDNLNLGQLVLTVVGMS